MTADTPPGGHRFDDRPARRQVTVAVIGQGHVGLRVAMRACEVGYRVVGFDTSASRVGSLRAGRSHVGDVSDQQLAVALASGYRATDDADDLALFDVAVITVPTPLADGAPDLSCIERAAADLGPHVRRGCCVVLESTTYPGTTTELVAPALGAGSGLVAGRDFALGYSPERIDPGNHEYGLVNTPKVVSGVDAGSLAVVDAFYRTLVDTTVPVADTAEAELVKLLENTFRHVNIALVNELAIFARELGLDVWRAIAAASTKPYGYMPFTPGPGVGGHCLPIDPSFLGWAVERRTGDPFRFVELANDVNRAMPGYVVDRLERLVGGALAGQRVLLLGLAYKRGTSDWRESPSIDVAARLVGRGAIVTFCDPHVARVDATDVPHALAPWSPELLAAADVVLVLVDHEEFDPEVIAASAPLVLDTRNVMRGVVFRGEVL